MKAIDVVVIEMDHGGTAPEQWTIHRVIQKDRSFDLGAVVSVEDDRKVALSKARHLAEDGGDCFFAVQGGFDLTNLDAYPACSRCGLRTRGVEIDGFNGARNACPDCLLTISTHRQRN